MRPLFTTDELAALRSIDAELDARPVSLQEYRECDERDRRIKALNEGKEISALDKERVRQRAWYEANRTKHAKADRKWRAKNPDVARKYYLANREYRLQWQREYRARKRAEKMAAGGDMT